MSNTEKKLCLKYLEDMIDPLEEANKANARATPVDRIGALGERLKAGMEAPAMGEGDQAEDITEAS